MQASTSFDYSGCQVLVTGGSNGIGLGTARAYRDAGAKVIITGRKPAASDYDHDFSGLEYRCLDVASEADMKALVDSLAGLDILVNSAGGAQADEWDFADFQRSLAVNLSSVQYMAQACRPMLKESGIEGGGSVIGIASMTSYFGFSMIPGYGAAKAGLVQLMKTLAQAWGEDVIRANAVAAGLTRSNMTAPVIDNMPEFVEPTIARQAIKRLGEPVDIANAILFLTSAQAAWITGQTLAIDGGYSVTLT